MYFIPFIWGRLIGSWVIGRVGPPGAGSWVGAATRGCGFGDAALCVASPGPEAGGAWARGAAREGSFKEPRECPAVPCDSPAPRSSPGAHTGWRSTPHARVRSRAGNPSAGSSWDAAVLSFRARWPGAGRTGGNEGGKESGKSQPALRPG